MSLKKINAVDGLSEAQFNAEPGRHIGLLLLATGTNNSGKTGKKTDVGRFIVTRNGRPLINRGFKKFTDIDDLRKGTNIFESKEGDTFHASAFIPFAAKGLANALNIRDEQELNIRFLPNDDGTVFDNLTIQVQSQLAQVPEHYEYIIQGNDLVYSSAVSAKPARLNTPNVSELFIEDIDDVMDSIQFESNESVIVSDNSKLALQALTNYNNRIEDPSYDVIEIENLTPGIPGSAVNETNILRVSTSGAGSVDVTVASLNITNGW
jgi:hypothetical protein